MTQPIHEPPVSERDKTLEEAAKVAEHLGRVFGEKPPSGERGTNIVWDQSHRIAAAIRTRAASGEGQ